jgi:hypothetical protein
MTGLPPVRAKEDIAEDELIQKKKKKHHRHHDTTITKFVEVPVEDAGSICGYSTMSHLFSAWTYAAVSPLVNRLWPGSKAALPSSYNAEKKIKECQKIMLKVEQLILTYTARAKEAMKKTDKSDLLLNLKMKSIAEGEMQQLKLAVHHAKMVKAQIESQETTKLVANVTKDTTNVSKMLVNEMDKSNIVDDMDEAQDAVAELEDAGNKLREQLGASIPNGISEADQALINAFELEQMDTVPITSVEFEGPSATVVPKMMSKTRQPEGREEVKEAMAPAQRQSLYS